MVELIGDVCQPSWLTVPEHPNISGGKLVSGGLMMSGGKLVLWTGNSWEEITSA